MAVEHPDPILLEQINCQHDLLMIQARISDELAQTIKDLDISNGNDIPDKLYQLSSIKGKKGFKHFYYELISKLIRKSALEHANLISLLLLKHHLKNSEDFKLAIDVFVMGKVREFIRKD
jgi:hypothetical protein